MAIRLGMRRESLGHEAHFYKRLDSQFVKRVENAVQYRPAINRLAFSVLRVNIRRTPFQRRRPIPGVQQVVHANVDRHRTKLRKFAQQFLPVRRIGVVRFVVTKVMPDGRKRPVWLLHVDSNLYSWHGLLRRAWRNNHCENR